MAVNHEESGAREPRLTPRDLAGGQLDAAQLRVVGMPAAGGVEIAAGVNRGVPVALEALARLFGVAPDDVVAARTDVKQSAAWPVGFRDKHVIADDDGIGGVDAFEIGRAPGKMEIDLATGGLE